MFENYSIEAQRVIFFGREEAGRLGSDSIAPEHLFLALLDDSIPLVSRFVPAEAVSALRKFVEQTMSGGEPIPDSVDQPLTESAVRVLETAEKLAQNHGHPQIRPIHILAAVVTVNDDVAGILAGHGISKEAVFAELMEDGA